MKDQSVINNQAKVILNKFAKGVSDYKYKRFRNYQAYISECLFNRYFLIRSYQTIVGIIDDQQAEFFELGKWSRTTTKQINKILSCGGTDEVEFGVIQSTNRFMVDDDYVMKNLKDKIVINK